MRRFKDRQEAGRLLGDEMRSYRDVPGVVILGLPRGGVVLAAELAKALEMPMDVFVVRKLGVPVHPELAMGALATGGVRVLNHALIENLGITAEEIDAVAAAEEEELQRRERTYRPAGDPLELAGKTVILVDDGLATGATMRAAVRAIRERKAGRVVVAVPVASQDALDTIRREADDVVCLLAPVLFQAVGQWYEQFEQVEDDEVRDLMTRQQHAAEVSVGS